MVGFAASLGMAVLPMCSISIPISRQIPKISDLSLMNKAGQSGSYGTIVTGLLSDDLGLTSF